MLLYLVAPVSAEFQVRAMILQILSVANIFELDGTGLQHNTCQFVKLELEMKQLYHNHLFFRMLQLVTNKLKHVQEKF